MDARLSPTLAITSGRRRMRAGGVVMAVAAAANCPDWQGAAERPPESGAAAPCCREAMLVRVLVTTDVWLTVSRFVISIFLSMFGVQNGHKKTPARLSARFCLKTSKDV